MSLIGVVKSRVIQEADGVIAVQDLRPIGILSRTNLKTRLVEILNLIKRVVRIGSHSLLVGQRLAPGVDLWLEIKLSV